MQKMHKDKARRDFNSFWKQQQLPRISNNANKEESEKSMREGRQIGAYTCGVERVKVSTELCVLNKHHRSILIQSGDE